MTNLEKIKNMSVEELARWIADGVSPDPCDYCGSLNCYECEAWKNEKIIAEWLESEVAE